VSRRFLQKLEAVREACSHACPDATTEELLEEALDLLLAREEKRRTAAATRPLATPRPASEDHLPAHVRREVWARDEGMCQWPLDGGGTCGSTHRLQLDHVVPAARGGPPTAANLRILCEPHNKEAARRQFGARWMARFTPEDDSAAAGPGRLGRRAAETGRFVRHGPQDGAGQREPSQPPA
jgi:5-methylcytosine-specific restriction endonuclease McrA